MNYLEEFAYQLSKEPINDSEYYVFQAHLGALLQDVNEQLDVDDLLNTIVLPAIRERYQHTITDITKLEDFRFKVQTIEKELGEKLVILFKV